MSANDIVGYTYGGTPVYSHQAEAADLGGDCHYIPSKVMAKRLPRKRMSKVKKVMGVRVYGTKDNSLARKAGMTSGDVITHIDGISVTSPSDIGQVLASRNGMLVYIRFRYNGGSIEKVKPVRLSGDGKTHPKLGIFVTKDAWTKHLEDKRLVSEMKSLETKTVVPSNLNREDNSLEFTDMTKPMIAPKAKLAAKLARRTAVADAVVAAKEETVEAIQANDDDFFGKKAKDELALVNGLLKDRRGADAYLAARKLRRELETSNKDRLEASSNDVSNYLNSMKAETTAEPAKRRTLSKLGKFFVGASIAGISIPACYYIAGYITSLIAG